LAAFEDKRAQVACGWPGTWRSANEQVCLGCLVDSNHGREMVRGLIRMNNAAGGPFELTVSSPTGEFPEYIGRPPPPHWAVMVSDAIDNLLHQLIHFAVTDVAVADFVYLCDHALPVIVPTFFFVSMATVQIQG